MTIDHRRSLDVRVRFALLVRDSGLPPPTIDPQLPGDLCDSTDAHEVRLNVESCNGCADHTPAWHAAHVFGHWLCDLHGAESYEQPTRPGFEGVSDMVADYIANLLKGS